MDLVQISEQTTRVHVKQDSKEETVHKVRANFIMIFQILDFSKSNQ